MGSANQRRTQFLLSIPDGYWAMRMTGVRGDKPPRRKNFLSERKEHKRGVRRKKIRLSLRRARILFSPFDRIDDRKGVVKYETLGVIWGAGEGWISTRRPVQIAPLATYGSWEFFLQNKCYLLYKQFSVN